ncbi:hypothetical protein PSAC2689_100080 [Paraburkholderia sacchari]
MQEPPEEPTLDAATPLAVGQTDGEHIGCYLFGIEEGPMGPKSYHSLATTREELLADCREFFASFAELKEKLVSDSPSGARHRQDVKVIRNTIDNLDMFVDEYMQQRRPGEPFLAVAGVNLFLTTGVRKRGKIEGQYIE